MPITQERFIDQINVALDILQALRSLIRTIHALRSSIHEGSIDYEGAFKYIIQIANENTLIKNPEAIAITLTERNHFKTYQKRNARKAAHMAAQRRADGRTSRAPTDLHSLNPIPQSPPSNQLPETSPEQQMAQDDLIIEQLKALAAAGDSQAIADLKHRGISIPTPNPDPNPEDVWGEDEQTPKLDAWARKTTNSK